MPSRPGGVATRHVRSVSHRISCARVANKLAILENRRIYASVVNVATYDVSLKPQQDSSYRAQ
jgi:hypothetical protein